MTIGGPLAGKGVLRFGMVPTCLFWYFTFEDKERTMGQIISLFFETLYLWTTAFVSHLSISFSNFLVRFALSS
jgi:hypothetical protein